MTKLPSDPWVAYIVFNAKGIERLTKTKPALKAGEWAVVAHLTVPRDFFNRALPQFEIVLPSEFTGTPQVEVRLRTNPKEGQ